MKANWENFAPIVVPELSTGSSSSSASTSSTSLPQDAFSDVSSSPATIRSGDTSILASGKTVAKSYGNQKTNENRDMIQATRNRLRDPPRVDSGVHR